jgi:hypothetical protein
MIETSSRATIFEHREINRLTAEILELKKRHEQELFKQ